MPITNRWRMTGPRIDVKAHLVSFVNLAMRAKFSISAAVFLLVVGAGAFLALRAQTGPPHSPAFPVMADLGGDFELSRAGGVRVRLQDYHGRIVLLFFGYTYCPDVCPTSLHTLQIALDNLGKAADRVQVIMITVDPERDSPEHLEQYVHYFHPGFVGLSGTTDEIERVAHQYRAYYKKGTSLPGGYLVSHSAYVYLLDQQGKPRAIFDTAAKPADIADGVRQLLREG